MMKTIQFLSASDRLNYGDLLFPLITKTVLCASATVQFENYGLIHSDLTHFGALPTKGYRALERENSKECIVVIGGGHVLFSTWNVLYGHLNMFYLKSKRLKPMNVLYSRLNLPRILFTKSKTISPFAPYHLKGKLVYLSAGGNIRKHIDNKFIFKMLSESALLSVRDQMLYQQLQDVNIDVRKVPDTAVIMSELFPKEALLEKTSANFNFDSSQKYVVVQAGLGKGPKDATQFVKDINQYKNKGYAILCLPIGLAPDHEDDKVLTKLMQLDSDWKYYRPRNIFEIMYLIGHAEWFLGTSLHGCITAFAYKTKFIPLNKRVKKLNNYTKTWWHTFLKASVDYKDLGAYIKTESENNPQGVAEQALSEQQAEVFKNYDRLLSILTEQKIDMK